VSSYHSDNEREVYTAGAEQYERLIQREDYQGNILQPDPGYSTARKADGRARSGHGRLTRLLRPLVKSIYAFDLSAYMLKVAASSLQATGERNWGWRSPTTAACR